MAYYRHCETGEMPSGEPAVWLARPWVRMVTVIIDCLIYLAAAVVGVFIGLVAYGIASEINSVVIAIIPNIVTLVVQMYLLVSRGQTIGKIMMGIRIVDAQTGEHPGWARLLFLRIIVHGILMSIPFAGFIYLIVDTRFVFRADRRTIHDLIAGTRVDKIAN